MTRVADKQPVTSLHSQVEAADAGRVERLSGIDRLRDWLAHRVIRAMMACYAAAMAVAGVLGRRRRPLPPGTGRSILLTGTFHAENWVQAHLHPLAASRYCSKLWIVSTSEVPPAPKLEVIRPPRWLTRLAGGVPARLMVFCWTALRRRPDMVGGFHLLVNGLVAGLMARIVGAQSLYFCVGGPMEVLDGGIWAENRLFSRMKTPDAVVHARLIRAVDAFDTIITMGTRAVDYFRRHGVSTAFHVVPGGMDPRAFSPAEEPPCIDMILVGRLAEIKRIDVFLEAVALVKRKLPGIRAVVVGEGEMRPKLERLARTLDIETEVQFAGHQRDVTSWLRRSKVFVLTSDSEGLALSMMEAMMCGVPVIVSKVGDLADLVEDGVNGWLVPRRSPEAVASRILGLLGDDAGRRQFSEAARESAIHYASVAATTGRWDGILAGTAERAPRVESNGRLEEAVETR